MRKRELLALFNDLFFASHPQLASMLHADFLMTESILKLDDNDEVPRSTFISYTGYQAVITNNQNAFFKTIFTEYLPIWREKFSQFDLDMNTIDRVVGAGLLTHFQALYEKIVHITFDGRSIDDRYQLRTIAAWEVMVLSGIGKCFDYAIAHSLLTPQSAGIDKYTALHWAVFSGEYEQVKCVLDFGVDPNQQSMSGITPLHLAAKSWDIGSLELLVTRGANIRTKDNSGSMAIDYAYQASHFAAMLWLVQHGAAYEKNDMNFYLPGKLNREKSCSEYYCFVAWVYIKQGEFEKALIWLQNTLDSYGGGLYFRKEFWDKAIEDGFAAVIQGVRDDETKLFAVRECISGVTVKGDYVKILKKTELRIADVLSAKKLTTSGIFTERTALEKLGDEMFAHARLQM